MNITGDFDPDAYGKPKFNSTILVPNERLQVQEGIENTGQNALKLSPILKDRVQFTGSNGSPLSIQQYFRNPEDCSELQDSHIRAKRMRLEEETSSSVLSKSKFAEIDKENMEMRASESNTASEGSTQLKNNSTARSHITNPFDSDIVGSLCTTTYSPSLFNNSKKNAKYETPEKSFRWSIGQLADLHPVAIDETESMCPTPNPVQEDKINNAVNKFWASQQYVLPSPYFMKGLTNFEQEGSPSGIQRPRTLAQDSPVTFPVSARFTKSSRSINVQTLLTFPPNFDLIRLLGNCFQYQGDQVTICDADLSLNTLRRKLFRATTLSPETNIEDENEGSMAIAVYHGCDQPESFSHERPAWYHSNDDLMSARRVSFDGVVDPNERAKICSRLISPDISPIKN